MKFKIEKQRMNKILACLMMVALMTGVNSINTYALSKEEMIENLPVNITWYDFGNKYTNYFLETAFDTGFYRLAMSDSNYEHHKDAYINKKGEIVLPPDDYEDSSYGSMDDNVTIVRKGDIYNILENNTIKSFNSKDYKEIQPFLHGYAEVTLKSNEHKAIINENGTIVFEDVNGTYKDFELISNKVFVGVQKNGQLRLLDLLGTPLNEILYSEIYGESEDVITVVSLDKKYGCVDMKGKEILPSIYDQCRLLNDGLVAVCKDGKWGFVDTQGKEVINYKYDDAYSFEEGFASVSIGEKWGVITKEGKVIIPIEYDYMPQFQYGYFYVNKERNSYLFDSTGELLRKEENANISVDTPNRMYSQKTMNGLEVSAFFDIEKNNLTGFKNYDIEAANDKMYLGVKYGEYPPGVDPPNDYNKKYALLDKNGNNLTGFKYSNCCGYSDDFVILSENYYDKMGLLNEYGTEVLPTIFDKITISNEGYVFVEISYDETRADSKVGYFKITPEILEMKNTKRPINVYLNGIELYFTSEPIIKEQRTMVPMRKIFESMGSKVEWNNATKTVTAINNDKTIKLTIGSDIAYVDGVETKLDVVPMIKDGATLVPLRFVSENLGAEVTWDKDLKRVNIISKH